MGIVSVTELKGPKAPRSSKQDQFWVRTYTRHWLIITDSPTVDAREAREAIPCSIGQTYSAGARIDTGSFVQSLEVSEDSGADDGRQWVGTAEYGPYQALQKPSDPTLEQPKISWGSARFQKIADQDKDGNPVVNSAGDPFDPPAMMDDQHLSFSISRNEMGFDALLADDYKNKVNDATFWVFGPRMVKCLDITSSRVLNPDIGWYYETHYEFEVKKETWSLLLLDQGMRQLSGSTGQIAMLDSHGDSLSSPHLLDGSGHPLAVGATPTFLKFDVYPERDFSVFNFDAFFSSLSGS